MKIGETLFLCVVIVVTSLGTGLVMRQKPEPKLVTFSSGIKRHCVLAIAPAQLERVPKLRLMYCTGSDGYRPCQAPADWIVVLGGDGKLVCD